jgi:hypothetical protein
MKMDLTGTPPVLRLAGPEGDSSLDLTRALRATMYDRPLTRCYTVSEFAVRGLYPFDGGLKAHLVNEAEGLFVPLILRPEADGFRASVPAGQIVEQRGINRKLMELALFPDLMSSRVGDEGFFLLPCVSGVLVRFREHEPTVNRDRLYMEQPEWEKLNLMNCFAVNRQGRGILGIVHRGDFNCHIVSEINQKGQNRIYPAFTLRRTEGQVIKQEDKEVVYAFSSGRAAEYPGMALRYHRYLRTERGVSPLKDRMAGNPVLAYSVTAMRTKIFMGCKQPSLPDGSGTFVPMTTCEQAGGILDRMKAEGLDRAVITLVGWNLGGHDGAYPTRFPIEPAIGGEAALRALIAKALGMGYQIVPHDNVTEGYRRAPDFDPEYATRTAEGEPRVVGLWSGGQSYKLCPTVYYDRYGGDVDRIRALGFQGSYLCDAQSSVLWTCHDPRHPADEEQYAISLAKLTQIPRALYGAVSTEIASAFSLPFVDEVTAIHTHGNADYCLASWPEALRRIADRIVPFYPIAVHGLILYQQSWVRHWRRTGLRKGLLRELAYGARPSMEVTWTGVAQDPYEDAIRDVKEAYRRAFVELPDIHAEAMADYEELAPEAARVAYGNGRVLTVNWGPTPAAGLPAESVRVG